MEICPTQSYFLLWSSPPPRSQQFLRPNEKAQRGEITCGGVTRGWEVGALACLCTSCLSTSILCCGPGWAQPAPMYRLAAPHSCGLLVAQQVFSPSAHEGNRTVP